MAAELGVARWYPCYVSDGITIYFTIADKIMYIALMQVYREESELVAWTVLISQPGWRTSRPHQQQRQRRDHHQRNLPGRTDWNQHLWYSSPRTGSSWRISRTAVWFASCIYRIWSSSRSLIWWMMYSCTGSYRSSSPRIFTMSRRRSYRIASLLMTS